MKIPRLTACLLSMAITATLSAKAQGITSTNRSAPTVADGKAQTATLANSLTSGFSNTTLKTGPLSADDLKTDSSYKIPLGPNRKYFKTKSQGNAFPISYGIIDESGKTLLPPVFTSIEPLDSNIRIQFGSFFGLYDQEMHPIFPVEYFRLEPLRGTGLFIVSTSSPYDQAKLVDAKGKNILPDSYTSISRLTNPYNPLSEKVYLSIGNASRKQAVFDVSKKKFLTPFEFDYINPTEFGNIGLRNGHSELLNDDFAPVSNLKFDNLIALRAGIYRVQQNGKYGLLYYKGNLIVPCQYDKIEVPFSSMTLFTVSRNNNWQLIDHAGRNLFPQPYQLLKGLGDDKLLFKRSGKQGVITVLGDEILPARFDTVYFSGKFLIAQTGNSLERYDPLGHLDQKLPYTALEKLEPNYFIFTSNGKKGLLNSSLNELIPAQYDKLEYAYSYGEFIKAFQGNRCGLISVSGQPGLPVIYEDIRPLGLNNLILKKDGKYGMVNRTTLNMVHECDCDLLSPDPRNNNYILCIKGDEVSRFRN